MAEDDTVRETDLYVGEITDDFGYRWNFVKPRATELKDHFTLSTMYQGQPVYGWVKKFPNWEDRKKEVEAYTRNHEARAGVEAIHTIWSMKTLISKYGPVATIRELKKRCDAGAIVGCSMYLNFSLHLIETALKFKDPAMQAPSLDFLEAAEGDRWVKRIEEIHAKYPDRRVPKNVIGDLQDEFRDELERRVGRIIPRLPSDATREDIMLSKKITEQLARGTFIKKPEEKPRPPPVVTPPAPIPVEKLPETRPELELMKKEINERIEAEKRRRLRGGGGAAGESGSGYLVAGETDEDKQQKREQQKKQFKENIYKIKGKERAKIWLLLSGLKKDDLKELLAWVPQSEGTKSEKQNLQQVLLNAIQILEERKDVEQRLKAGIHKDIKYFSEMSEAKLIDYISASYRTVDELKELYYSIDVMPNVLNKNQFRRLILNRIIDIEEARGGRIADESGSGYLAAGKKKTEDNRPLKERYEDYTKEIRAVIDKLPRRTNDPVKNRERYRIYAVESNRLRKKYNIPMLIPKELAVEIGKLPDIEDSKPEYGHDLLILNFQNAIETTFSIIELELLMADILKAKNLDRITDDEYKSLMDKAYERLRVLRGGKVEEPADRYPAGDDRTKIKYLEELLVNAFGARQGREPDAREMQGIKQRVESLIRKYGSYTYEGLENAINASLSIEDLENMVLAIHASNLAPDEKKKLIAKIWERRSIFKGEVVEEAGNAVREPQVTQATKDKIIFISDLTEYITAVDRERRKRAFDKLQASKFYKEWFDTFFHVKDPRLAKDQLMKFFVANEQGLDLLNYAYFGAITEYLRAITVPRELQTREASHSVEDKGYQILKTLPGGVAGWEKTQKLVERLKKMGITVEVETQYFASYQPRYSGDAPEFIIRSVLKVPAELADKANFFMTEFMKSAGFEVQEGQADYRLRAVERKLAELPMEERKKIIQQIWVALGKPIEPGKVITLDDIAGLSKEDRIKVARIWMGPEEKKEEVASPYAAWTVEDFKIVISRTVNLEDLPELEKHISESIVTTPEERIQLRKLVEQRELEIRKGGPELRKQIEAQQREQMAARVERLREEDVREDADEPAEPRDYTQWTYSDFENFIPGLDSIDELQEMYEYVGASDKVTEKEGDVLRERINRRIEKLRGA